MVNQFTKCVTELINPPDGDTRI